MSRLCTSFSVIAIWLIFPGMLGAQRGGGMGAGSASSNSRTLSGTVYYPGNKAADHITVELHSTEGSMISPATTTASGGYEFHNLGSTTYALVINEQGYQPVEQTVDLNLTSSRGIIIYLTPIESKSASPVSHSTVSAHELAMPQKARDLMDSGKEEALYGQERARSPGRFSASSGGGPGLLRSVLPDRDGVSEPEESGRRREKLSQVRGSQRRQVWRSGCEHRQHDAGQRRPRGRRKNNPPRNRAAS